MLNTDDTLVQYKITSVVCSILAVIATLYRLHIRRGRMSTDDAWAIIALLLLAVQIASVFMHVNNSELESKSTRVAAYYLLAITFYAVTWASRISIIYGIVRIDPNPGRKKTYKIASCLYLLTVIILIIQLFWVCEPEPSWKDKPSPQCHLTLQVAICQLVLDIFADGFLLIAPLRLVSHLQDKAMRTKLILVFSTCLVTTIVSMVHAAFILASGGRREVISAIVEDTMSLVVCNVPVVVTALMRHWENFAHPEEGPEAVGGNKFSVLKFASRHMGMKTTFMSTTMGAATTGTDTVMMKTVTMRCTDTDMTSDPILLGLEDGVRGRPGRDEKGSEKDARNNKRHDESSSGSCATAV